MLPFLPLSLSIYIWADAKWFGTYLWLTRISWPGCVPSQDLVYSQLLWWMKECQWDSSAQQQPKHWSVINTLPATNTKHSTAKAVNFTLVRPNTPLQLMGHENGEIKEADLIPWRASSARGQNRTKRRCHGYSYFSPRRIPPVFSLVDECWFYSGLVVGGHLENVCDGVTKHATLSQRNVFWDTVGWQVVYILNLLAENSDLYLACKIFAAQGCCFFVL